MKVCVYSNEHKESGGEPRNPDDRWTSYEPEYYSWELEEVVSEEIDEKREHQWGKR